VKREQQINNIVIGLGVIVLVVGLVVIFGWHTKNTTFIQILPSFAPMQYNTALGFVFSSLALITQLLHFRKISLVFGVVTGLIGILTLSQDVFGYNLNIDEFFMVHDIIVGTSAPGRMAPNTAFCFFLLSLFSLTSIFTKSIQSKVIIQAILSSLAFGLSFVALTGYIANLETAYGWGNLTRMALHTSVSFVLLSFGSLIYTWVLKSSYKKKLPQFLPIPVFFGMLTIAISLWQALSAEYSKFQIISEVELNNNLPLIALIIGILLSFALALSAYLAQNLYERAASLSKEIKFRTIAEKELTTVNLNLEGIVEERTKKLQEVNQVLEKEKEKALAATVAKSSFLANMSHELRTPMNAIIGYSEMLIEDAEENEQMETIPDLQRIKKAGKHLLNLINDILDLSKIEAGKSSLVMIPINTNAFVDDIKSTMSGLIESNGNSLTVEIDSNIEEEFTSDYVKLKQSVLNLLSNAAKFTKNGKINLRLFEEEGYLNFEVSDNGIGIAENKLVSLFDEFTQADETTTKEFGGTGLGLAITKRFCHLLKGEVTVTSELGKGSVFTIQIPMKTVREKIINDEVSSENIVKFSVRPVLVIEDDPAAADLIERVLVKEGYHVIKANGGKQGVDLAKKYKPFVITLDIMMPDKDGWSVLAELKKENEVKDIPVIVISVLDSLDIGYALGAKEYLTKPVQKEKLLEAIESCVPDIIKLDGHVLIVDDEEDAQDLLTKMLTKRGWKTEVANNGQEALDKANSNKPSLILLDLMMPVMDGFAFMREIQKNKDLKNIPVVVVTARNLTAKEFDELNEKVREIVRKGDYDKEKLNQHLIQMVNNVKIKN
jgi:signal transduction histidine kinase/CheY-like chemotaxis protein